jgi:hypothetical protein
MMWFRRKPTPSEAARVLSELSCLSNRERIKARARLMREQMGLEPAPILEPGRNARG